MAGEPEKEGTIMAPNCDQQIADDDPALTCIAFEVLRGELAD